MSPDGHRRRTPPRGIGRLLGSAVAAGAAFLVLGVAAAPAAVPGFQAYGSCATRAPFPRASTCRFDAPGPAQATIVFRSSVGRRSLRVCQKITGLSFTGRQCLRTRSALAYKPIPFRLNGASGPFTLSVTISARKPASHGGFRPVARTVLRFRS
jgi:hypothetical protein